MATSGLCPRAYRILADTRWNAFLLLVKWLTEGAHGLDRVPAVTNLRGWDT